MPTEPLVCPTCGDRMNHHADKLIQAPAAGAAADPDLGGVVEESHCCPSCGSAASRLAVPPRR